MIGEIGRREFIGWTATGAAELLLPTIVRPKPKVFDMGRASSPGRIVGPRALFYDRAGILLGELALQVDCSGAGVTTFSFGRNSFDAARIELHFEVGREAQPACRFRHSSA